MNAVLRGLLVAALVITLLGFGAMSLCGGVLMLSSLPLLSGSGSLDGFGMSLPFALGGFFMARLCVKKIRAVLSRRPSNEDLS